MKAKTAETSCFHKKYTSIIYDNDGGRLVYINPTNTTKRMANVNTRQFNSALSAHVVKETEQLQTEIDRLKKDVERLEFMIEHGLGPEDMVNDITMPHEI